MKMLAFIVGATIFEAVGDAVMRIALHYHVMPGRILLFASATVLLAMYGAFLNLAPIEFASATGIYLGSLFIAFQIVNYLRAGRPARRNIHSHWCGDYLLLEID